MPQKAESYKPPHAIITHKARMRKRSEDARFYKRAHWTRFRRWFLAQPENVMCADCRNAVAVDVHHIKPVKEHPDLAYEPTNCRALCKSCHAKITRAESA